MIKINYPTNLEGVKMEYLKIFKRLQMSPLVKGILSRLSISKDDLLIGSFDQLVDYCQQFDKLGVSEDDLGKLCNEAYNKYEYYSSKIANFFINPKNKFQISTCSYCNMSYINTFVRKTKDNSKNVRQFDLDHVIPKSDYPIVALSLFNFVPSCKVCNQIVKRAEDLIKINNKSQAIKLSPTSDKYDFENNVTIKAISIPSDELYTTFFEKDKDKFQITFDTQDEDYKEEINFFHLNDRYDYHKLLALRLLEKQERYPESNIKNISKILGRDVHEIREDIFNERFVDDYHRTFSKLYKDIMKYY